MLQEFMDVFLDEIPGLPPKRDIVFTIELVSGEAPVSKTPYRMSTPEMLELKMQLQELLEKKYIRPSVSPWGAPVLFVKKNMVHSGFVLIKNSRTRSIVKSMSLFVGSPRISSGKTSLNYCNTG